MDTLVIMAIVVVAIVFLGIFFVMKYSGKSGGNDDVWKPGEEKGSHPEG